MPISRQAREESTINDRVIRWICSLVGTGSPATETTSPTRPTARNTPNGSLTSRGARPSERATVSARVSVETASTSLTRNDRSEEIGVRTK